MRASVNPIFIASSSLQENERETLVSWEKLQGHGAGI